PLSNIVVSGTSSNRTITIRPATNQVGSAAITLSVEDADGGTATTTFTITVEPVNDPPTLDEIGDLTLPEDAGLQVVQLTGITSGFTNEDQVLAVTLVTT